MAFVLEQTLGHVTHSQNLRSLVPRDDRITATFSPIEYELNGWPSWVPGYSNWTVRAGVRARRAIRNSNRGHDVRVLFIHTQVPAVLAARWMKRIPTVVSVDATPIQYDQLGTQYMHERAAAWQKASNGGSTATCSPMQHISSAGRNGPSKALSLTTACLRRRSRSLHRASSLPSGRCPPRPTADDSVVKILFVGGDLERKGGSLLIEAVRQLRSTVPHRTGLPTVELHLANWRRCRRRAGHRRASRPPPEQRRTDRPVPRRRCVLPAHPG